MTQIHRKTDFQKRRSITKPLKIIDSSALLLNLTNYQWDEFHTTKSGLQLHLRLVFMGKGHLYPNKAVLSNATRHDRNHIEIFIDDKEYIYVYVFDRDYLDYERIDRMTDIFSLLVCVKNAVIRHLEAFELPTDGICFIS